MSSEHRTVKATCLCGACRHEFSLPGSSSTPITASYCHCTSCRRMTGCLSLPTISIATDDTYTPSESLLSNLTAFEFSKDRINLYFCSTCGAHVLAHVLPSAHVPGEWLALCGTFQKGLSIQPRHEFVADTLDGGAADLLRYANDELIERWAGPAGEGEQLPLYSDRPQASHVQALRPADKLYAHCKCRGIEFWVSRPSDGSKYVTRRCGCDSCRLASGMESFAIAWAHVPRSQLSLSEDHPVPFDSKSGFGTLRVYESSKDTTRGFCNTCGANVFLAKKGSDTLRIAVGLLCAPEGARAETWLDWSSDMVTR